MLLGKEGFTGVLGASLRLAPALVAGWMFLLPSVCALLSLGGTLTGGQGKAQPPNVFELHFFKLRSAHCSTIV